MSHRTVARRLLAERESVDTQNNFTSSIIGNLVTLENAVLKSDIEQALSDYLASDLSTIVSDAFSGAGFLSGDFQSIVDQLTDDIDNAIASALENVDYTDPKFDTPGYFEQFLKNVLSTAQNDLGGAIGDLRVGPVLSDRDDAQVEADDAVEDFEGQETLTGSLFDLLLLLDIDFFDENLDEIKDLFDLIVESYSDVVDKLQEIMNYISNAQQIAGLIADALNDIDTLQDELNDLLEDLAIAEVCGSFCQKAIDNLNDAIDAVQDLIDDGNDAVNDGNDALELIADAISDVTDIAFLIIDIILDFIDDVIVFFEDALDEFTDYFTDLAALLTSFDPFFEKLLIAQEKQLALVDAEEDLANEQSEDELAADLTKATDVINDILGIVSVEWAAIIDQALDAALLEDNLLAQDVSLISDVFADDSFRGSNRGDEIYADAATLTLAVLGSENLMGGEALANNLLNLNGSIVEIANAASQVDLSAVLDANSKITFGDDFDISSRRGHDIVSGDVGDLTVSFASNSGVDGGVARAGTLGDAVADLTSTLTYDGAYTLLEFGSEDGISAGSGNDRVSGDVDTMDVAVESGTEVIGGTAVANADRDSDASATVDSQATVEGLDVAFGSDVDVTGGRGRDTVVGDVREMDVDASAGESTVGGVADAQSFADSGAISTLVEDGLTPDVHQVASDELQDDSTLSSVLVANSVAGSFISDRVIAESSESYLDAVLDAVANATTRDAAMSAISSLSGLTEAALKDILTNAANRLNEEKQAAVDAAQERVDITEQSIVEAEDALVLVNAILNSIILAMDISSFDPRKVAVDVVIFGIVDQNPGNPPNIPLVVAMNNVRDRLLDFKDRIETLADPQGFFKTIILDLQTSVNQIVTDLEDDLSDFNDALNDAEDDLLDAQDFVTDIAAADFSDLIDAINQAMEDSALAVTEAVLDDLLPHNTAVADVDNSLEYSGIMTFGDDELTGYKGSDHVVGDVESLNFTVQASHGATGGQLNVNNVSPISGVSMLGTAFASALVAAYATLLPEAQLLFGDDLLSGGKGRDYMSGDIGIFNLNFFGANDVSGGSADLGDDADGALGVEAYVEYSGDGRPLVQFGDDDIDGGRSADRMFGDVDQFSIYVKGGDNGFVLDALGGNGIYTYATIENMFIQFGDDSLDGGLSSRSTHSSRYSRNIDRMYGDGETLEITAEGGSVHADTTGMVDASVSIDGLDLVLGDDFLLGGRGTDHLFGDFFEIVISQMDGTNASVSLDVDVSAEIKNSSLVFGDDDLDGGRGNDLLVGDTLNLINNTDMAIIWGDDLLTGGSGRDDFQFALSEPEVGKLMMQGDDVITDLNTSLDDLVFKNGTNITDLDNATAFSHVLGDTVNTVIDFNGGGSLTLLGLEVDSFADISGAVEFI